MFIYISPPGLLRLFPCSLRVSFLSFSAGSPCGSRAFPPIRLLSDAVSVVFPCPFHIVFPPFPITVGAALSRSLGFPFVSLHVVACRWAVCYRFPLIPVSSPVSLFRAVGRGGVACSVGCGFVPWRGVAGMGGCPAVLFGGSFPVGAWGGAFWVVFSCGNYREGCSLGEADLLRRVVRERPWGFRVPSGRFARF